MSVEAWIAFVIGAATLAVNICTLAVGYGILRGTVNALKERVVALERGERGDRRDAGPDRAHR